MTSFWELTVTDTVVDELNNRFGAHISKAELETSVNAAARDLAGSVSAESLPEMAVRLAVVRLGVVPEAG
jgi:hypothetical protein